MLPTEDEVERLSPNAAFNHRSNELNCRLSASLTHRRSHFLYGQKTVMLEVSLLNLEKT